MDIVAAQKRRDFSAVEALLADGFHEIGSSGRLFSKSEILDAIQEVQIIDCSFDRFKILPIDKGCVIVTMWPRQSVVIRGTNIGIGPIGVRSGWSGKAHGA